MVNVISSPVSGYSVWLICVQYNIKYILEVSTVVGSGFWVLHWPLKASHLICAFNVTVNGFYQVGHL